MIRSLSHRLNGAMAICERSASHSPIIKSLYRGNTAPLQNLSSLISTTSLGGKFQSRFYAANNTSGLLDEKTGEPKILEDAEDEDFLPTSLIEELKNSESAIAEEVRNTRGLFKEQICRTPMMGTSVKKLNKLSHLIKGLDVEQAMLQLMFVKRDDAGEVLWAIKEGLRIAEEIQKIDPRDMFVAYTYLCRGSYTKSYDIKGRGRTGIIRNPQTYMVIMLRERAARVLTAKPKGKDVRIPFPSPRKDIINPRLAL